MIFVSFLDFEKITQIIGIFTLIVIIMVLIIAGHSLIGHSFDFEQLNTVAKTLPTNMPNIWVSVLNYFAICVMTGVSMVFVLGGSIIRIGVAEKGGTLGGAMVGLIIAITSLVLFVNVGKIASADIPMLVLANEIHPWFAFAYSLVVFGLIFNTAFSLYYALAKHFSENKGESQFKRDMIIFVVSGYALSFLGFKQLVSVMYPILGYIGLIMLVVLLQAWIREKGNVQDEKHLRRRMISLISKKYDDDKKFTKKDKIEYQQLGEESVVETKEIKEDIHDHVKQVFDSENDD